MVNSKKNSQLSQQVQENDTLSHSNKGNHLKAPGLLKLGDSIDADSNQPQNMGMMHSANRKTDNQKKAQLDYPETEDERVHKNKANNKLLNFSLTDDEDIKPYKRPSQSPIKQDPDTSAYNTLETINEYKTKVPPDNSMIQISIAKNKNINANQPTMPPSFQNTGNQVAPILATVPEQQESKWNLPPVSSGGLPPVSLPPASGGLPSIFGAEVVNSDRESEFNMSGASQAKKKKKKKKKLSVDQEPQELQNQLNMLESHSNPYKPLPNDNDMGFTMIGDDDVTSPRAILDHKKQKSTDNRRLTAVKEENYSDSDKAGQN